MLRTLLNNYQKHYPDEKLVIEKTLNFLNNSVDCFSRSNTSGHFTGSGWLTDKSRRWVVMTHHKKLNKWLQLGGHADGNKNLQEVALEECIEESGLQNIEVVSSEIFDIDIHTIPQYENIPKHLHFDVRFLFEAEKDAEDIIVSNESNDVAWIKLDDVAAKNNEISILRMLEKIKNNKWA